MDILYKAAADFYDAAPWFHLSSHNVIEIINTTTNQRRVMQICGNSFNDTGLILWKSQRDFKRILVPGMSQVDAIVKGECYQTIYYPENEAEPDVKKLYAQHKFPTPQVGGVKFYADITLLANRAPSPEDLIFMFAALTLAPIFVNKHMVPGEKFDTWLPVEKKFNLSNVFGNSAKTLYHLRYPAEGKTISLGERRLGPLPSGVDPIRADSVQEAFDSEKKVPAEALTTPNVITRSQSGRMHLQGLSDALWKLGQTDKAADIASKMLFLDPSDDIGVTDMLLDFVLELGRYDAVLPLLTKQSPTDPLVLWTNALVDYVKYGKESEKSQKALVLAIKHHPGVISIIIGHRSLPRELGDTSSFMVGVSFSASGMEGNFAYAAHYCKNFAKYWRHAPGAVDWLKDYGLQVLNKLNEPGVKESMKNKFPAPKLLVCYKCHQQKESGLMRCGRCKSVSYCSKECQKAHWKEHKEQCNPVNL